MNFILFLWAIAYSLAYKAAEKIGGTYGCTQSITAVVLFFYLIVFVIWIVKSKQSKQIYLNKCRVKMSECLLIAPAFAMPVYNLYVYRNINLEWSFLLIMVSVAVVEELFFRGFLQQLLRSKTIVSSIIKTNVLFSVYHLANLYSTDNVKYVLWQMICAFVIGLCYSFIMLKVKSILPCIALHFLTNITVNNGSVCIYSKTIWIVVVIYVMYAAFLWFDYKRTRKQENLYADVY